MRLAYIVSSHIRKDLDADMLRCCSEILDDASFILLFVDIVEYVLLKILVVSVILQGKLEQGQVSWGDRKEEALHPQLFPLVGFGSKPTVLCSWRKPFEDFDLIG